MEEWYPINRKDNPQKILFFAEEGEARNFVKNILEKGKPWGTSVDTIVE